MDTGHREPIANSLTSFVTNSWKTNNFISIVAILPAALWLVLGQRYYHKVQNVGLTYYRCHAMFQ